MPPDAVPTVHEDLVQPLGLVHVKQQGHAAIDEIAFCAGQPGAQVLQQECQEDGSVGVVYPPEYATMDFTLPSWVPTK